METKRSCLQYLRFRYACDHIIRKQTNKIVPFSRKFLRISGVQPDGDASVPMKRANDLSCRHPAPNTTNRQQTIFHLCLSDENTVETRGWMSQPTVNMYWKRSVNIITPRSCHTDLSSC